MKKIIFLALIVLSGCQPEGRHEYTPVYNEFVIMSKHTKNTEKCVFYINATKPNDDADSGFFLYFEDKCDRYDVGDTLWFLKKLKWFRENDGSF